MMLLVIRAVNIVVYVVAMWFVLYALNTVDAPDWSGLGQSVRDLVTTLEIAWDDFWTGFYQR